MRALLTANYSQGYLARLAQCMQIVPAGFALGGDLMRDDTLVAQLAGCDIFIVGYDDLSAYVIERLPDLRLIASIRGGPDANVDLAAATAAGIPVLYTVGRTEHAVAEYVIALMLSMARPIFQADRKIRDGSLLGLGLPKQSADGDSALKTAPRDIVWPLEPATPAFREHQKLFGTELFDKKLGLVGFGNIGRAVSDLGKAFGMHILVHDPFIDPATILEAGAAPIDLMGLMAQSDYVSLHARVTPQSAGMIGREQLRAMKPTACLVNTARAALVVEDALLEALDEGWFRMAALDVHHREPLPLNYQILKIDHNRVILGPHLAGSTREVEHHHSRLLTDTILAYLRGQRPRAVANPAVFESPNFAGRGSVLQGILT